MFGNSQNLKILALLGKTSVKHFPLHGPGILHYSECYPLRTYSYSISASRLHQMERHNRLFFAFDSNICNAVIGLFELSLTLHDSYTFELNAFDACVSFV